jgi:hypothetical protein
VTPHREGGVIDPRSMTCCLPRHPSSWRRIEVQTTCQYAWDAARVLVFLGAADEAYATWFGVPGQAVWSLNGEPMLPEVAS